MMRLYLLILLSFLACSSEAGPTDPDKLAYFRETYEESRSDFRKECELRSTAGANLTTLPVASQSDSDLTIDLCYLPATDHQDRILIITSGVHGIEGLAGSTIQRFFMAQLLPGNLSRTGILLIHSVNPFGFRNERRVTENNVDLNRNFATSPALFSTRNEGYADINEFLNPEERVSTSTLADWSFGIRALLNIARHSMQTLRRAALQGQYDHPRGVFFGGSTFEPQKAILEPVLRKFTANATSVMLIDLHTGYGTRGKMHLRNAHPDQSQLKAIETVYSGFQIDYGAQNNFYAPTGEFVVYVGQLLKPGVTYVPMLFEFGTLDSQTMTGSIASIHNMILENAGFHHNYAHEGDRINVKRRFREHFYPESAIWRTSLLTSCEEILPRIIDRFNSLETGERP
ncbi:MAG: DUF2817 domain-containing protein [Spirochaetia bacterium]|nr:DUF2817 domain-containing protein [Spirochaetia bacterium]